MLVRQVDTWEDVELLRDIRNASRGNFTEHNDFIPYEDQMDWWAEGEHEAYLFERRGFAYISEREGKKWITLGIFPHHQGRGLGTKIYAYFPGVWARIRKDNPASIRAAEKAGYKLVSEDEETVVMRSDPAVQGRHVAPCS